MASGLRRGGKNFTKTQVILETLEPLALGTELTVTVTASAESYASVAMAEAYSVTETVRTVETLNVSALTLEWNKEGFAVLSAEPVALAAGKTVRVSGDLAAFGLEGEVELVLNEFGRCSLALTGTQSGCYHLSFTMDNSSLEATAEVTVLPEPVRLEQRYLRLALGLDAGDTASLQTTSTQDGLVWASADPTVATIENGLVRAVGSGRTSISVSLAGHTDTCVVEVLGELYGLRLPAAMTTVEEEAFRDNDSAQYVMLPESVNGIGDYAFADDDSLLLVFIPALTTEFGENVFADSDEVIVVGFRGSSAQDYCLENEIAFQCVG